ncbi:hypothetical protein ACJX0J_019674, partial [Zea mays]
WCFYTFVIVALVIIGIQGGLIMLIALIKNTFLGMSQPRKRLTHRVTALAIVIAPGATAGFGLNMLIGYAYPKMLILRNKKNGLLNDLGSIWLYNIIKQALDWFLDLFSFISHEIEFCVAYKYSLWDK